MAIRTRTKPYLATNPRTIAGAFKRGWRVVELTDYQKHNVSYVGLVNWATREAMGYVLHEFWGGHRAAFAFENHTDAFWFESRWS